LAVAVFHSVQQYLALGEALFRAAGASPENARRVTESLVSSSLSGHDSHGVIRYIQYVKAIEDGQIDPRGEPRILKETETSALVDGAWSFGQVGGEVATKIAVEKARRQGIALAALVRAHHIGRLGEYSEMAYEVGMIAMVFAGGFGGTAGTSTAGVAPYGGARGVFSTNPLSFGLPSGEMPPVMVDFATSAVAGGKISLARAKGEQLPPNSILDREGNPTTDPEDYYNGGMLTTFGGHKGYGLAVVIELLGQAMTGSLEHQDGGGDPVYSPAGSVFIAINPALFVSEEAYRTQADAILRKIKAIPPRPGFDEVLTPGEPEQRARASRSNEGISLPEGTWNSIAQLAGKYGVDVEAVLRGSP
jgi:LDH2 family malate/lactate/ureidoglycolate dehydrogenase